ncbi:MAG: SDR family oxidoreductase [Bryobacteraceae bacterium]
MKGRTIVLAGGSGGLGAPCARRLAEEGARVIVGYRSNRARAAELSAVAEIVQADLAVPEDRARLLDAAEGLYGLVVFAGDPARAADPERLDDALRLSHEVNYLGPILLAREAASRMKRAGTAGSIVLFSTMQAGALFAGSTVYAGAKAALIHASRILAKECRGRANIRVNVICPGVHDAGMARASIAAGKYDRYVEEGIIPRFGAPEDVGRAVRFFLEPDGYVTGQVLMVDGGLTL